MRIELNEQARLRLEWRANYQRRAQRLAKLSGLVLQIRWDLLPLKDSIGAHFKDFFENETQPLEMDSRVRTIARLVIAPFIVCQVQAAANLALVIILIKSLRKAFRQHRHTQI